MKRLIVPHWTAGNLMPTEYDKEHYHFLVGSDLKVHQGKYKPEDNDDCTDGHYAAHLGGGNTNTIGAALCGFYGYSNGFCEPQYTPSKEQFDVMYRLLAGLIFNEKSSLDRIKTHAEFGLENPNTSSAGKVDIEWIPYANIIGIKECGDYIRARVKEEYLKIYGMTI